MAKTMKKSDVLFGGSAYPIKKALGAWRDLETLGQSFAGKRVSGPLKSAKSATREANQKLIKGEFKEAYCKAGFIGNDLVVRIKTKKPGIRGASGYTHTDFVLAKNCRGKQTDMQPVKKGGPSRTVTLLEHELMGMLQRRCKPFFLDLRRTRVDFRVTMTAPAEVYAALDDDPLLLAKVTEAASAEYEKTRKHLEKRLLATDGKIAGLQSKAKKRMRDRFVREVEDAATALEKSAVRAARQALERFKKTRTSYRDYKISIGGKVVSDLTNLGCSVTCAVASGGWGLAVAIYGAIKAAIDLTRTLVKAARDAQKQRKVAERFLQKVEAAWDKAREESGSFSRKEAGTVVLNHFLKAGLPTVSKAQGEVTTYGHKLEGIDLTAHKSARQLNGALRAMDKFDASLRAVSDPTLKKNLKAHVKEVRKCTTVLLGKIVEMQEQVREGRHFARRAEERLQLLADRKSKVVGMLEKGLFLTDLALGGSTISWDGTTKAAQKAGDLLLNVVDPFLAEVNANLADELR